jgi:hypothetical protein
MYVNGVKAENTSGGETFTYSGMHNTSEGLTIGSGYQAGDFLNGELSELAIWNRELSAVEAKALHDVKYGAMSHSFTSYSPRLMLRHSDNLRGEYPTTSRIGDKDRTGRFNTSFNDLNVVNFGNEQSVQYPIGLPLDDSKLPDIVSDIVAPGIVLKGTGDQTFNITTTGEDISAFNDERIHTDTTAFYMTGTSLDVYPGFDSPLKSKVAFRFDITADEEQYVFRQNSTYSDENTDDPLYDASLASSPLTGEDFTGFCYFAFGKNKWEQIGLIQPEDGNTRQYLYNVDTTNWVPMFPQQFCGVSGFSLYGNEAQTTDAIKAGGSDALDASKKDLGYDKIGLPTVSSFAPFATQYHATSSQALSVSSFINTPFLLEKISISLPVYARHMWTNTGDKTRDQSTYMMFLYLQTKTVSEEKSLLNSVKSSRRTLIASASINFYNNKVLTDDRAGTGGDLIEFSPINESNFSQQFDSESATLGDILEFDDTIRVDFTPSISNAVSNNAHIPYTPTVSLNYENFWPGGNEVERFVVDTNMDGTPTPDVTGYESGFSLKTLKTRSDLFGAFFEANEKNLSGKIGDFSINKSPVRTVKNYGSKLIEETPEGLFTIRSHHNYLELGSYSQTSPFILMPGDELILGIEKTMTGDRLGPGTTPTSIATGTYEFGLESQHSFSGSLLKIKTEPASMTLFGSQIRENKEYINTLNQDLTSLSVHEAIYGDDVIDQFDIEPVTAKSGSYTDVKVEGDILETDPSDTRKITASAAAFRDTSSGVRHSLQRNVMHYSKNERYYDTMLPDIFEYLNNTNDNFKNQGFTDNDGKHYKGITYDTSYLWREKSNPFIDYLKSFPFQKTDKRNDHRPLILAWADVDGDLVLDDPSETSDPFLYSADWRALFSENVDMGFWGILDGEATYLTDKAGQTGGANGFKYGVMNTTQIHTHATFRHDRYGQFRDLLEQRMFSTFIKTKNNELSSTDDDLYNKKNNFRVTKNSGPISAIFVEPNSETSVRDPLSTVSSNLNVYMTSSLPFFDDVDTYNNGNGRNRTYSPNLLQQNSTAISSNAVLDFDFDPSEI